MNILNTIGLNPYAVNVSDTEEVATATLQILNQRWLEGTAEVRLSVEALQMQEILAWAADYSAAHGNPH
jgi:hypothetical protein